MQLTTKILTICFIVVLNFEQTISRPANRKRNKSMKDGQQLDFDVINDKLRVEGMPLFQGDIVMDESMIAQIMADESVSKREKRRLNRLWQASEKRKDKKRTPRAAMKSEHRIWGNGELEEFEVNGEPGTGYGVIPYVMDPNMSQWKRTMVEDAIKHWEEKTKLPDSENHCIKFVPWTGQEDYINIVSKSGCWSKVGKDVLPGPQNLSIGSQCGSVGLIAHEIGHALGFFHEQNRPDRDEWVTIVEENVNPRRTYNFVKYSDWLIDPRDVAYDYSSIMHYKLDAFSRNGLNTIEPPKDLDNNIVIGQREGVSEKDVEQIRRMYRCSPIEVEPTTESPVEVTEKKGSWLWDFRKGEWIWNEA